MKLTIVIVNYNVRHFLWQCLHSVEKAISKLECEVYVVDNASKDGSMEMVSESFPWVKTIENKENTGFSVANNQAMRLAKGAYILLLNPDTILEENTLTKAIEFMDAHPNVGGLGAKMLDGAGTFLPESKRGLPTPAVAFYKIFGISLLFPKSPRFSRYHLGHLDPNQVHEVDVLAGAFMLMRKEALDKVGLLDEQFFMYGEDIDLSYRIVQGGYKNYYHPDVRIIHYKGESTKKGSINYVYVFYRAMVLFAKKHFSARFAGIYSALINLAIWLRASLAILRRLFATIRMPFLDVAMLYGLSFLITNYWEQNHRFIEGGAYPALYYYGVVPFYVACWLVGVGLAGGYLKPVRISRIFSGVAGATIFLIMLYGLLPEDWRFSRALIILGGGLAAAWFGISRTLLGLFGKSGYQTNADYKPKVLVVTTAENTPAIQKLLLHKQSLGGLVIFCKAPGAQTESTLFHGDWENRKQLIQFFNITEIIFDTESLSYEIIISEMQQLAGQMTFEIFQPEAGFMIGSDSIHTQGAALADQDFILMQAGTQRAKRLFDLLFGVLLISLLPILIWTTRFRSLMTQWTAVVSGKKSWVGFDALPTLPKIKAGAIPPYPNIDVKSEKLLLAAQRNYMETYDVNEDFRILVKYLRGGD
jgi:GT2 family glycosyltransferase